MKFLIKRSKLIHILYGVLCFVLLVSAVAYLTQYANVRVLYSVTDGIKVMKFDGLNLNFVQFYQRQGWVVTENSSVYIDAWTNFANNVPTQYDRMFSDMSAILSYQEQLIVVNDLILYFGLAALVLFAFMLIIGNQSRKVYYKSNLIVGIAAPSIVSVLMIVLLVFNSAAMQKFSENKDLFNYANLLVEEKYGAVNAQLSIEALQAKFNCDITTFIVYNLLFILVLIASLAMVAYAVFRFMNSAEKRKELIAKAVSYNE